MYLAHSTFRSRKPLLWTALLAATASLAASDDVAPYNPVNQSYDFATPDAAAITSENVYERDRYWPDQVVLPEPVELESGNETRPNQRAIVIRLLEPGDEVLLDFGRGGVHTVPIEQTDFVERAEAMRTGERTQIAPNLVLALSSRLVDPDGENPVGYQYDHAKGWDAFALIVAAPAQLDFEALKPVIEGLWEAGVHPIWIPLDRESDVRVWKPLYDHQVNLPYVFRHFAEPYVNVLGIDDLEPPYYMLMTENGKLLDSGYIESLSAERAVQQFGIDSHQEG